MNTAVPSRTAWLLAAALGALSMISDSPYLSFTVDASGHCLSIGSSVASSAMPKRP